MKKLMLAMLFVCFTVGVVSAGVQDFTIYNDTDYVIEYVYVSPASSSSWEEDILGDYDVLDAWDYVDVSFSGYDDCYWDIQIIDEDGDVGYIYDVYLCGIWAVHFEWDYSYGEYTYWTE